MCEGNCSYIDKITFNHTQQSIQDNKRAAWGEIDENDSETVVDVEIDGVVVDDKQSFQAETAFDHFIIHQRL